MGTVAGCTVHLPFFVERENVRNFNFIRGDNTRLVFSVIVDVLTGIDRGTIMAGIAHVCVGYCWFFRKGCQCGILFLDKESVNPAVVTDGTFLGGIGL